MIRSPEVADLPSQIEVMQGDLTLPETADTT
jgi:hypothetical protein